MNIKLFLYQLFAICIYFYVVLAFFDNKYTTRVSQDLNIDSDSLTARVADATIDWIRIGFYGRPASVSRYPIAIPRLVDIRNDGFQLRHNYTEIEFIQDRSNTVWLRCDPP